MTKKFEVTKEVAYFCFKGRRYKPGETVELPDSFPTGMYAFLKPVAGAKKVVPVKSATVPNEKMSSV